MGSEAGTPSTVRCTEPEALRNVAAVLQLCQAGRLRCSATTRRPSAATVTAVREVLVAGDFYPDEAIAAFAWPLLLQGGGLAELQGSRLALTAKGRAALGRPAHEVIRDLWERWPRKAPIDEFSRIEQIKGQKAAAALSAAGPRRQAVAAALGLCPPGEWIGVDVLFTRMSRAGLDPRIARSERGLWKLYIVDPEYGSFGYEGYGEWPVLEGRYTLAVLFEYAATLGLLDVEYVPPADARDDFRHQWGADDLDALSRYDGLRAVRLTALGAYATGATAGYEPPPPAVPDRALHVLPNHDVVAVADLAPADRMVLDTFAVHSSERVWTFSTASLLAAVDAGRAPGEFAAFLDARSLHPVPAAARTLFDDVEARAGQVRDLGVRCVLECADASVATLLERDRSLRRLVTRVGERHLLLDPAAEPKVRAALRALGYPLGSVAG
jgi:XPB/Ssl2-like helicase family protein